MTKRWFTADHHFGHANIIRYCDRPFKSVDEMDAVMIDRWNEVVAPADAVYHVGDFTLLGYEAFMGYVDRLNGQINIVPGSHDHRWVGSEHRTYGGGVRLLPPLYELRVEKRTYITLCHYAMRKWPRSHHGTLHLFGHSHGRLTDPEPRSMDIGVDCWDFRPVHLSTVLRLLMV